MHLARARSRLCSEGKGGSRGVDRDQTASFLLCLSGNLNSKKKNGREQKKKKKKEWRDQKPVHKAREKNQMKKKKKSLFPMVNERALLRHKNLTTQKKRESFVMNRKLRTPLSPIPYSPNIPSTYLLTPLSQNLASTLKTPPLPQAIPPHHIPPKSKIPANPCTVTPVPRTCLTHA